MARLARRTLLLGAAVVLCSAPASAQHSEADDEGDDCTFCNPWVYLDGAALWRAAAALPDSGADETPVLVRGRFEIGSFVPRLGLFATMEFMPADGASPTITFGLMAWGLRRGSDFNVTVGLGFIDRQDGVGETTPGAYVMRGWGQVRLQYHTPVHEISLYAQAGVPFSGSQQGVYQLGLSHPLAPYTFRLTPSGR